MMLALGRCVLCSMVISLVCCSRNGIATATTYWTMAAIHFGSSVGWSFDEALSRVASLACYLTPPWERGRMEGRVTRMKSSYRNDITMMTLLREW